MSRFIPALMMPPNDRTGPTAVVDGHQSRAIRGLNNGRSWEGGRGCTSVGTRV